MTNEQKIEVLIFFLPDVQPAPQGPKTGAGSGQGPSIRQECDSCQGFGRTTRLRPCIACGGDLARNTPGRGWIEVDSYTGEEVSTETQYRPAPFQLVICDACGGDGVGLRRHRGPDGRCMYCEGSGRRKKFLVPQEPIQGAYDISLTATRSTAASALRALGSFYAVEQALAGLAGPARRLLEATVGRSLTLPDLSEGDRYLRRVALAEVTREVRRMEGHIRVPRECRLWAEYQPKGGWRCLNGHQKQKMREQILAWTELGFSQRWISQRTGIRRPTVSRIIQNATAADMAEARVA